MSDNYEIPSFKPETQTQLKDAISWAISERKGLYVQGSDSKASMARPTKGDAEAILSLKGFDSILTYEAAELIMTTGAGTSMSTIHSALEENNQILAFEPMDNSSLYGIENNAGTIGGAFATNLSGPRRLTAGAARDYLLGFQAISGRGEAFKSGGQVMKNVTGYDLSKLMTGSWGTLGAMHEISFKVLPKPETSRTLIITGVEAIKANGLMTEALKSAHNVSSASWLPETLVRRSSQDILRLAETSLVALRIEGAAPSVEARCHALRTMFSSHGRLEELHDQNSESFWSEIRDVTHFAKSIDDRVVWKVSVAPAEGHKVVAALAETPNTDCFMDWGGGLIWIAADAPNMGAEAVIRKTTAKLGGHATLMRGSELLRKSIDVMPPLTGPVAALSKRIKDQFDPLGILNPGRLYESHQKRGN